MSDHDRKNTDPFQETQKAFRDATDPQRIAEAQAAMGLDPSRMQDAMRTMTEKSVEQSRQAYEQMRQSSDEATKTLESTLENAHSGSLALSRKAIDAMRRNAEMGFSHLESLAGVKSMAELIELQTSFVRRQVELVTDQAKEIQTLSQTAAQDMMRPARDAAQRAGETMSKGGQGNQG